MNPFSPQGQVIGQHLGFPSIGPNAQIDYTNGLLSLKAGYPVDFRQLPQEELDDLVRRPWPSAEQLRENSRRLKDGTARKPQAVQVPQSGARVDEEGSQRRCLVGPYEEIEPICRGQAHHIVPDMVYRLGARPTTAAAMASTADRVPNAPTFNQGMAICLLSQQHGSNAEGLHGVLRGRLAALPSPVAGTAPMGLVTRESVRVVQEIPDLPPECKALAASMTAAQVGAKTGLAAPGRTLERPLPTGQAKTVLERGRY